jgi:hypothetical protein
LTILLFLALNRRGPPWKAQAAEAMLKAIEQGSTAFVFTRASLETISRASANSAASDFSQGRQPNVQTSPAYCQLHFLQLLYPSDE